MALELIQQHIAEMDFAFQNVVKYILRHSKLTVSLIKISNVAEDTFHVSIEARTTNTGPASATLSAFTIDLCGPAGRFGQVHLPAITTRSDGAPIIVTEQLVRILDKAALQAFIKPVIVDGHATLVLREGHTTVKALGIGPRPICYEKDIPMSGMLGPRVRVRQATAAAAAAAKDDDAAVPLTVTIRVANPSPMEISFGACALEIRNEADEVLAELRGDLNIRCNHFEATFRGTADKQRVAAAAAARSGGGGRVRLVGRRCEGAGWCDETVKQIDTPLMGMCRVFEALGLACGDEATAEEGGEEEEGDENEEYSDGSVPDEDDLLKRPVAAAAAAAKKTRAEEPARAAPSFWHGRFWKTQVS